MCRRTVPAVSSQPVSNLKHALVQLRLVHLRQSVTACLCGYLPLKSEKVAKSAFFALRCNFAGQRKFDYASTSRVSADALQTVCEGLGGRRLACAQESWWHCDGEGLRAAVPGGPSSAEPAVPNQIAAAVAPRKADRRRGGAQHWLGPCRPPRRR